MKKKSSSVVHGKFKLMEFLWFCRNFCCFVVEKMIILDPLKFYALRKAVNFGLSCKYRNFVFSVVTLLVSKLIAGEDRTRTMQR